MQVEVARKRVEERGLSDRIELLERSATNTQLEGGSFDKVIALESAFHFDTRLDFFREAKRLLRPGGKLVTADILSMPGMTMSLSTRVMFQIPNRNLYSRDEYRRHLVELGFTSPKVYSIREHVFAPWAAALGRRMDDPDFASRLSPILRVIMKHGFGNRVNPTLDYVIAVAER